jgi:dihydrolipoamide dehydrogenase
MSESAYDCVIVGSGPGGYVAAIRAAQLEMKTAVIEKDLIGGRCLNYACIPAKAMLRVADVLSEIRDAGEFGITVAAPTIEFDEVVARRSKVVKTLTGGVGGLFKKNGIDLIEGAATLSGEGQIRVGDRELSANTIVLAAGSVKLPVPGIPFGGQVIGTEEAWSLGSPPASLAIVGAGASGVEIASAYARMGATVSLFEALDRVLPTEDADISRIVERGLKKQGIAVHTGTLLTDVSPTSDGVTYRHDNEFGSAQWLVIAAGRTPDAESLGLAEAGVEFDEHGLVRVDDAMRTSAAGVYAIGDMVAGPALAHKASDEGVIAVEDAAGMKTHALSYIDIPRATFCTPNVASFGLTEAQAREQGHAVTVGKVQYGAVGAGTVYGDRSGLVKLVGHEYDGTILGGHIVGVKATELIQQLVNVKALEGGFPDIAGITHGHPTLSEAVMEAARAADGWLVHG